DGIREDHDRLRRCDRSSDTRSAYPIIPWVERLHEPNAGPDAPCSRSAPRSSVTGATRQASDESVAEGGGGGGAAVGDGEFVEDAGDVGHHRAGADREGVGDLLVAEAFGQQAEHVQFTAREGVSRAVGRLLSDRAERGSRGREGLGDGLLGCEGAACRPGLGAGGGVEAGPCRGPEGGAGGAVAGTNPGGERGAGLIRGGAEAGGTPRGGRDR